MTGAEELLAKWRKTYSELFPHRPPEAMRFDDATLAGLLMLQAEFEIRLVAIRSAMEKNLRLDRIDRYDPKAPE